MTLATTPTHADAKRRNDGRGHASLVVSRDWAHLLTRAQQMKNAGKKKLVVNLETMTIEELPDPKLEDAAKVGIVPQVE